MSTNNVTIYLKAEQNIEVQKPEVCVKDIASLTCADAHVLAKAKSLKLWTFQEGRASGRSSVCSRLLRRSSAPVPA